MKVSAVLVYLKVLLALLKGGEEKQGGGRDCLSM